jgi:hypothetical protein
MEEKLKSPFSRTRKTPDQIHVREFSMILLGKNRRVWPI